MRNLDEDPSNKPSAADTRSLRVQDLINLRIELVNCTIESGAGTNELVAGSDALLILHFPPQHLQEETFPAGCTRTKNQDPHSKRLPQSA